MCYAPYFPSEPAAEVTSGSDACRLLVALMEANKLTIQWFGLVCVAMRDSDSGMKPPVRGRVLTAMDRTGSATAAGLVGFEATVLAEALDRLGEEGREMAEEVLSGELYKRIIAISSRGS
jgi:hypothetical protein